MVDKKRTLVFAGLALLVLMLAGCDAAKLISSAAPTATRTKTPRPTFTLAPTMTSTPESSPTPVSTDTPEVSPTPTKKPTATRSAVTKGPPAPTAVRVQPTAAPSYSVSLTESYLCDQAGIYKITARIQNPSGTFMGGYVLGVFAGDGRFLKASAPSASQENVVQTLGGNCRVPANKFFLSNAEIDVSEFRGQLPVFITVVRSATDHTPLSAGFRADFGQTGNYFLQFAAP